MLFDPSKGGAGDHSLVVDYDRATDVSPPPSVDPAVIAQIRYWHRQRVFAMDQRKRSDLALGAFLRTQLGWSKSLPAAEAKAINEHASDLILAGKADLKGKKNKLAKDLDWQTWSGFIVGILNGRAEYDAIEERAVAEMDRLAGELPVSEWWTENVFKGSCVSLAVIVGETGDLSLYSNPAKLWKRMGLAVMDGTRQGGLRKTAAADEWISHGYSAKRRSYMFVIGDTLVKGKTEYRQVYLDRKEFERSKAMSNGLTVVPAAKIPAARKTEFMSDGHVHRRAQRYMEKRLLRDLWQAWRRTTPAMNTIDGLPAALNSTDEVERSATLGVSPILQLPSASLPSDEEGPTTKLQEEPTLFLSSAPTPVKAGKRRASGRLQSKQSVPAASSSPERAA